MNYNTLIFWVLFAIVYAIYWRLSHRRQNDLLLVTSYVFYGSWDYRFLFLILISTMIDFIGGLGVAGIALEKRRLQRIAFLIIGSAFLLCTNIHYSELLRAAAYLNLHGAALALPQRFQDFLVPLGTALVCLVYGRALPRLYAAPEQKRRKYFLIISMVANLSILGYFKYCNFFLGSFKMMSEALGMGPLALGSLNILLPAGISFYTFQAMSYTIDIYRGDAEPTDNLRDFALFVCFFPHLVAGPIMRAHTLLPQVVQPRCLQPGEQEEGVLLILIGLFKKLVIADNMAPIANAVFFRFTDGTAHGITGPEVLVGLYAFAFQIYGDFSGYSGIARGVSKLLGFELMVNFRMPYLAVSPSDFWQRWHISLSTWLRDYLYIPLGGNRHGRLVTYRNLMITMLLGGLWHGANWTFVAWGFYHGVLLCVFRAFKIPNVTLGKGLFERLHWAGRVVLMFHLTCLGWLLFRADSFHIAWRMGRLMLTSFHVTNFVICSLVLIGFYCGLLFFLEWKLDGENRMGSLVRTAWAPRAAVYAYLLLMLVIFRAGETSEFFYFQF